MKKQTKNTTTITAAEKRVNTQEIKEHLRTIQKSKAAMVKELTAIYRVHKELDKKAATICRAHDRDAAALTRRIKILSGRL
jgi:purine-nucleoside phosphorylase